MLRRYRIPMILVLTLLLSSRPAIAQAYPPGTFSVDGIPIVCGRNTFVVTPQTRDVGINTGRGEIYLNPYIINQLPTTLKLYWIAHE